MAEQDQAQKTSPESDQSEIQVKLDEICEKVEQSLNMGDESSLTTMPECTTAQQVAEDENESDSQYEDIDEEDEKQKETDVSNKESNNNAESSKEVKGDAENTEEVGTQKNPAIIPKKGRFYEHDIRGDEDDEEENENEGNKNVQRKPKKIDGMWTHDKFDPEAQNPRKAARRNAGTARNKFNGSGTGAPGFHGNKNDARRRPLPKKNSELEISDYVQGDGDKQQKTAIKSANNNNNNINKNNTQNFSQNQRRDVEGGRVDRRTPQHHLNSDSPSEARDEKSSNENKDYSERNRTQNQRGPRQNFDRNRDYRFNEDVNNNRRPKSYNNFRGNHQDSQQSSDTTDKQVNLSHSLNFSNKRYRRPNEQNRGAFDHGHDDRTQPQQQQNNEQDDKPKRYSSMRNQRPVTSAKTQSMDNQKNYSQHAHNSKLYGGEQSADVHHFDNNNQNWKANGGQAQMRQGRPIVGAQSAGMNTSASVYSPNTAAAVAAAANLQLYNTQAIPMVLQAQQILSPPPGISMPQLMQQQQQQQQFYNFVPYQYQS